MVVKGRRRFIDQFIKFIISLIIRFVKNFETKGFFNITNINPW